MKKMHIAKYITPPHLCTPSRIISEITFSDHIQAIHNTKKIKNVIDLGCGGGEYRFFFPDSYYIGIDLADNHFSKKQNIKNFFMIADANMLPIKANSQDVVLCMFAFQYFLNFSDVLDEIYRVMAPGGTALICVPTRYVKLYEVLSEIFRRLGFVDAGRVSAQPGIKHFDQEFFKTYVKVSGFCDFKIIPIYGWPILIFKTMTCWNRVFLNFIISAIQKFSNRKQKKRVNLYKRRKVDRVSSYAEWEKIVKTEEQSMSIFDKIFIQITKILMEFDNLTGKRPIVEFIVFLKKENRI
jgi:ubiquinone/menaquinone biosynthesis C-methylase UbiE